MYEKKNLGKKTILGIREHRGNRENSRYKENKDNYDCRGNREIMICTKNLCFIWKVGKIGKSGD